MKIVDIQTSLVKYPLPEPFKPSWTPGVSRTHHDVVLVRVITDEGITGVGAGTGSYSSELVVAVEERIKPLLLGLNPFHTELISGLLQGTTVQGHPQPWLVDIACWDVVGKATGQPICKLLGGHHEKLPAYVSTGELRSVEERLDDIAAFMEMGFKAVKIRFHHANPHDDMKVVEAIRKQFGNQLDIMVDVNQGRVHKGLDPTGGWRYHTAFTVAKELEQWDVYWMEEPLDMHDYEGLARLRREVNIPIAGAELNCGLHQFRQLLQLEALDIYQPDAVFAGGIHGLNKIAHAVEMHNAVFTPHTWSTGIGLAANLHVSASIHRQEYVEFPLERHSWTMEARDFMFTEVIDIDDDGYVKVPDGPGLGIELDEEKLTTYTVT